MELHDLTVRYGDKLVFDHRDFSFPDTGVTLLTGPSGAGKTTLLKALLAQYPRDSAFLFQEDRLLPWRTARQHLTDTLDRSRWGEVPDLLALVELTGEEKAYPGQLSGGMARRLALARCLALGGARYLLDEPFAGVDPPRQRRILERLRALDKPVILTGHGRELEEGADRVTVLSQPPGDGAERA